MPKEILGKTVHEQADIEELATDLELAIHNMWVDHRGLKDRSGNYDRVDIDVEITLRERGDV